MENQKFDPQRVELGVHRRAGFDPGHKPANRGRQGVSVDPDEIGGGFGVGEFADTEFEEGRAAAMKVGHSKAAASDEYAPDNIVHPQFPEPGGDYQEATGRVSDPNSDLETHGFHQHPKPDPRQIIKERLRNMRKNMLHDQEKEVQDQVERQEDMYESYKSAPTDIDIERKLIDIDRSGALMKGAALNLLEEHDASPIKIMLTLNQMWEDDWRSWEPETILQTLDHDGIEVAKINLDKIMALKVLLNTVGFWNDPRVFEKVCLAFAGRMVDWGHIQEPRVHEIAACVALVERYIAEHEFSDSVAAYVAGSSVRDGYVLLPPVLSFAEFPFSNELAFSMGDQVLNVQISLMKALEDESEIPKDHGVQYMRLLRCQYHIQDVIDQAKA